MQTNTTFTLVKPRYRLKQLSKRDDIFIQITNEVKQIIHITKPSSPELIQYVASLIENLVLKKHSIDKQKLLEDIIKSLYPEITEKDLEAINETLEFLLTSGNIKKISISAYARHAFIFFVKRVIQ